MYDVAAACLLQFLVTVCTTILRLLDKQRKVNILVTLVQHTTHEMQPLDTAVFGLLKKHSRDACHDFMQSYPGNVISKYQFSCF